MARAPGGLRPPLALLLPPLFSEQLISAHVIPLLLLFEPDFSRSRCETSARLGKAGVGLHQAVVPQVAPAGATELFCCLSSFIFAPSCSPVLYTQG